jgi:phage I-like protein
MKRKNKLSTQIGIAVCSLQTHSDGSIQIFPAGEFNAPNGASIGGSGPWHIDEAAATALIERAKQRKNDIVIDYEHQTLNAAKNGMPAPAFGWIKADSLLWVAGKGLMVSNPEWTEEGQSYIDGKKYKYLSPVFSFDKKTGQVLDLFQVALTNNPAIHGMDDLVMAAATVQLLQNNHEDSFMNEEERKALAKKLGLPADATVEEVMAACTALKTENADLTQKLKDSEKAIAAASAATPEEAVAVIGELQSTVAALTARLDGNDTDTLIAAAKADGKLTPAMETWARTLAPAALKSYLDAAPQIAALTGQQTDGKTEQFDKEGKAMLTKSQIAACSALGVSQEDYAKQLEEDSK